MGNIARLDPKLPSKYRHLSWPYPPTPNLSYITMGDYYIFCHLAIGDYYIFIYLAIGNFYIFSYLFISDFSTQDIKFHHINKVKPGLTLCWGACHSEANFILKSSVNIVHSF